MGRSISQIVAEEAAASEAARDDDAVYVRNRTTAKDPSQVYSLRIPVARLEELRVIAERQSLPPSALMRRWVLERLDQEIERAGLEAEKRHELADQEAELHVLSSKQLRDFGVEVGQVVAVEILDVMRKGQGVGPLATDMLMNYVCERYASADEVRPPR
jgi:hypothetical protein